MKGFLIMKKDLWLVNSSLLLMFILSLGIYQLFQQDPPAWRSPKPSPVAEKKEVTVADGAWDKIYLDDMFGTYIVPEIKAVKQSLITPIPEPKPPMIPPPVEVKKQEFIAPLNITLRGIIAGPDEMKNVAMIADETGKEGMYHVGEKVKDAQIIKIAHNRIVLLRANGQQEIFYLRKDEVPDDQNVMEKWKYIVRKVDDQTYNVDPQEFVKEIETLGHLIEKAGVIGAAYAGGKPIGIRLGKITPVNDVSTALGWVENDIITSVNGLDVADTNNRLKAYEMVIAQPLGSNIKVGIRRAGKDVIFTYNLARIERPRRSMFPGIKAAQPQNPPAQNEEAFKLNRLQQREQAAREFAQQHSNDQRQQSMLEMRRRILERLQNNRAR